MTNDEALKLRKEIALEYTLTFVGRDEWEYPTYVDQNGTYWKDIDCRDGYEDVLYGLYPNEPTGDPDYAMEKEAICTFIPERIKDPHDKIPKLVTII